MALNPGDLLFVGWDSDNNDIAFVATTDIAPGEVIYFTDDEWDGTAFLGSEQLIEWTVPTGGLDAGTVVTIDMDPVADTISYDVGGTVDYIKGGYDIAGRDEMFWAYQGTRSGNTVTPTNFVAVIANEATGADTQTPNLDNTGLTTSNGAVIIDGDEDYMEWTGDADLSDPVNRDDLIASILDLDNWTTADGTGNSNPAGEGFDLSVPDVVCFAAGTRIATTSGLRKVEDISVGQKVQRRDGDFATVQWIGRRHIGAAELSAHEKLRPVRIVAGALGQGLPHRDLLVSRQHRMLVASKIVQRLFDTTEVLVPAIALTGLPGIFVDHEIRAVTYFHILCTDHEVLLAEGAPAESLFLGPQTLQSLTPDGRAEIAGLFPDLCGPGDAQQSTTRIVAGKDKGRLVSRHAKNNKALLELY